MVGERFRWGANEACSKGGWSAGRSGWIVHGGRGKGQNGVTGLDWRSGCMSVKDECAMNDAYDIHVIIPRFLVSL